MEWRKTIGKDEDGAPLPQFDLSDSVWARLKWRRVFILAALVLGAMFVPEVPRRPALVSVVFANLVLTLVMDRFIPRRHRYMAWWGQLAAVVVIIAALIPELWSTSVMCAVAVGIWGGLGAGRPAVARLILPTLGALVVIGYVHQPDVWIEHMVVAVGLTTLTWHVTDGVRKQIAQNEAVLERSLSTSSSFVHIGDITSGRSSELIGPIEAVTGWTKEEWMQIDMRNLIHPEDASAFWIDSADATPGGTIERQARFRKADGDWVTLRDVSHIFEREEDGRIFIRGFATDVTAIEKAHDAIRRQAREDGLTGLPNRAQFIEELHERLSAGTDVAVIVMDVDRFKAINDTLGHPFGDAVLVEVATRLTKAIGPSDVVARLSGDEFAIIRDAARVDELEPFARGVATELSRPTQIDGMTLSRTVSIGIARRSDELEDAATLLRHADIAMYEAKQRQQAIQMFNGDIEQTPLEELTLSASLQDALSDDQFVLYYQPKIDLTTGAITGFEGLARWNHPDLGLLTPNRFIKLLAFSDEGRAFSDHVIESGIRFARLCADKGQAVPVAVNISALSLFDDGLPERVARFLERHEVPAEHLVIELTEADIMEEVSQTSRILQRLADLGVLISIDDFGTGYSSLARLADLPISEIKIDRRFVAGARSREQDRIIVRSIIDLAQNLGLTIMGEGVETSDDVHFLLSVGCHEAQGFLYSRPVPEAEAAKMLGSVFEVFTPVSTENSADVTTHSA